MSRPDLPGMWTSSRMHAGVRFLATANSAAPSAKQITSYPAADNTIDRVSRTAGSSSTTKISPREAGFSTMCHRPSNRIMTRTCRTIYVRRGIDPTIFVRAAALTHKWQRPTCLQARRISEAERSKTAAFRPYQNTAVTMPVGRRQAYRAVRSCPTRHECPSQRRPPATCHPSVRNMSTMLSHRTSLNVPRRGDVSNTDPMEAGGATERMPRGPSDAALRRILAGRRCLPLLLLALDELDVHLRAVHPNELPTAIGEAGR